MSKNNVVTVVRAALKAALDKLDEIEDIQHEQYYPKMAEQTLEVAEANRTHQYRVRMVVAIDGLVPASTQTQAKYLLGDRVVDLLTETQMVVGSTIKYLEDHETFVDYNVLLSEDTE